MENGTVCCMGLSKKAATTQLKPHPLFTYNEHQKVRASIMTGGLD